MITHIDRASYFISSQTNHSHWVHDTQASRHHPGLLMSSLSSTCICFSSISLAHVNALSSTSWLLTGRWFLLEYIFGSSFW
jgi:hypothetical protein